ncbi:MAG: thermonuclease family protein [Planctomycetes bacterium]|nr:thermonuclease family protein [Planctomycetota bacterium]
MPFWNRPRIPDSIVLPPLWRRHASTLLVLALVASGVVCARSVDRSGVAPTPGGDTARYHDQTFRVARVVDGDTLDIEAADRDKSVTRIRLWGVDTPEVAGTRGGRMHFGPEASEFAKQTLTDRDVHIVLSPKRTRGKYGRLLAYVFMSRGGRMFNEMLLEGGYAYADLRFDHHYIDRFKRIEKHARRSGAGLWADVTLEKMPAWRQRFEKD